MLHTITASANGQISGTFNEVEFEAQKTSTGKIQTFIVKMGLTILAVYCNNVWHTKPYPAWKHTVNQIFSIVKNN